MPIAPTGAAGGTPGAGKVHGPFAFAFNTPNIASAGLAVYTPTIGDILLNAWVEITTAFDGTTPKADLGSFVGAPAGWWGTINAPIDLTIADAAAAGAGLLLGFVSSEILGYAAVGTVRVAPARFTTADPIRIVVSQSGQKGGGAVGGAAGAGNVYLEVATPVKP